MSPYKRIALNHANLKVPLKLLQGTIAGYHISETTKTTHVYTTAGIFPAVETPEQIDALIDQLNAPEAQGDIK